MTDFHELVYYRKAQQLVLGVNGLIKSWPRTIQTQEISRQLFRSASSIGANIAEGHGRHEGTEYIHYLIIAQASANETDHWLSTALSIGLGSTENLQLLIEINLEIRRMLAASIATLKAKRNNYRVREDLQSYN